MPGAIHIGRRTAREPAMIGPRTSWAIRSTEAKIIGRGHREAGLDDVDAQRLETTGKTQLLVHTHREARRLFPVPQSRIEDDYISCHGHLNQ